MWLGTFQTAEEAARAYDETACLLRGSNTRTNFVAPHVCHDSSLASRIKNLLNKRKAAKVPNDSSATATATNWSTTTTKNHSPSDSSNSTHNTCNPTTSGGGDSSSSVSVGVDDSMILFDQKAQDGHLFEDTYKPDLRNCTSEECEMRKGSSGSQSSLFSWGFQVLQGFDHRFAFSTTRDHQLFDLTKIDHGCSLPESADHQF